MSVWGVEAGAIARRGPSVDWVAVGCGRQVCGRNRWRIVVELGSALARDGGGRLAMGE
jgi:hypothetical protein